MQFIFIVNLIKPSELISNLKDTDTIWIWLISD